MINLDSQILLLILKHQNLSTKIIQTKFTRRFDPEIQD